MNNNPFTKNNPVSDLLLQMQADGKVNGNPVAESEAPGMFNSTPFVKKKSDAFKIEDKTESSLQEGGEHNIISPAPIEGKIISGTINRKILIRKNKKEMLVYENSVKTVLTPEGGTQTVNEEKVCQLDDGSILKQGLEIDCCTSGHIVESGQIHVCPRCKKKFCAVCTFGTWHFGICCPFCDFNIDIL